MVSLEALEGLKMDGKDLKPLMTIISNQMHLKELENLKLRVSKEYELKLKDQEKIHYERLQLTK